VCPVNGNLIWLEILAKRAFSLISHLELQIRYFTALFSFRVVLCSLLMLFIATVSCDRSSEPLKPAITANTIEGVVLDELGPVQGAIVRVQATELFTTSDDSGQFRLSVSSDKTSIVLTAWAPGYYIGGGKEYVPGQTDVEITLVHHTNEDNPSYQWISAFASDGKESNCQHCHADPGNPNSNLPFDEWQQDAHAGAAVNPRFLTMYLGTDMYGNQSPNTRYGYSRDYGNFPLRPDPNIPYYGPGYKLDFPSSQGNCAACHTPMEAIDNPYGINPSLITGVGKEGVGCDFCHKVWDIELNPSTGLPYENMPGVLSFEFRRPPEGHQFFAGPLDDVAPGEDTYSPIQKESGYCAPCHSAKFWGVEIYNSYGEWLNSPYSDTETGQTCQDCHMPPGLVDHFARIDKGGERRNPKTIFSHRMPGAMDKTLLQNAVNMHTSAIRENGILTVHVDIENHNTGHHVPTDSPLRHLILLVQTMDESGNPLIMKNGPTLPEWCGVGDADNGYYSGYPGKAYAKILEEVWTGISPTGAYWNMTRIVSDNRIPAMGLEQSTYQFEAPSSGNLTVTTKLLFRRTFKHLQDWKSWDIPDIVMEEQTLIAGN
jgi:hypothetical protein